MQNFNAPFFSVHIQPPPPFFSPFFCKPRATSARQDATGMDITSRCTLGDPNKLPEGVPQPARMPYVSDKHPRQTLEVINLLRKHRELCDVVLVVGTKKIYAHRVILSACSPYFRYEKTLCVHSCTALIKLKVSNQDVLRIGFSNIGSVLWLVSTERCLLVSWQRAGRQKWLSVTLMREPWSCSLTLPTPHR